MSMPRNTTSYPDIIEVFDRALDSPKGLRMKFATSSEATRWRGRANSFRMRDRQESERLYPPSEPQHGKSVYDPLMVKKVSDLELEIVNLGNLTFAIEEIK